MYDINFLSKAKNKKLCSESHIVELVLRVP